MKRLLSTLAATTLLLPALAGAQEAPARTLTAEQSEQCIALMSGFPNDDPESRYLFFRLSQELAKDITPELAKAMADVMLANGADSLPADTPMMDVVESVADPVVRQAAPETTVAGMAHIAYFNALCGPFVQGQVKSLAAFEPALLDADIYIREDALYLRQILADAMDRLGGGDAVQAYAQSLVTERDDIEFTGFEDDVSDIEALFIGDLDEKLATSNDYVNDAVDAEAISSAIALARDMDTAEADKARRSRLASLCQMMPGCTVGY